MSAIKLFSRMSAAVVVALSVAGMGAALSSQHIMADSRRIGAVALLLAVSGVFLFSRLIGRSATLNFGEVNDETPVPIRVFAIAAGAAMWIYGLLLAFGLVGFPTALG